MAAKKDTKNIEHFILAWNGKKMGKFFGALIGFAMILLSRWPLTGAPRADAATTLLRLGWAFLCAYVVVGLVVFWSRRIILADFVAQGMAKQPQEEENREAEATAGETPAPMAESSALMT